MQAADGLDALEKIKGHTFDMVISDIKMPAAALETIYGRVCGLRPPDPVLHAHGERWGGTVRPTPESTAFHFHQLWTPDATGGTGAHVVYEQNWVFVTELPAAVDDFLAAPFDFRIVSLYRCKVEILGLGPDVRAKGQLDQQWSQRPDEFQPQVAAHAVLDMHHKVPGHHIGEKGLRRHFAGSPAPWLRTRPAKDLGIS